MLAPTRRTRVLVMDRPEPHPMSLARCAVSGAHGNEEALVSGCLGESDDGVAADLAVSTRRGRLDGEVSLLRSESVSQLPLEHVFNDVCRGEVGHEGGRGLGEGWLRDENGGINIEERVDCFSRQLGFLEGDSDDTIADHLHTIGLRVREAPFPGYEDGGGCNASFRSPGHVCREQHAEVSTDRLLHVFDEDWPAMRDVESVAGSSARPAK